MCGDNIADVRVHSDTIWMCAGDEEEKKPCAVAVLGCSSRQSSYIYVGILYKAPAALYLYEMNQSIPS